MSDNSILGVKIGSETVSDILQKVKEYQASKKIKFFHIANLNPDIFILAHRDEKFREIMNSSDCILIDGVGIQVIARLFGKKCGERMTGADLMELFVQYSVSNNKKVMFLGGFGLTSQKTGEYFQKLYPKLVYISDQGTQNIRNETKEENARVIRKIEQFKPDFLFVAYGPPYQEKWIYENQSKLYGIVCMGVGGSFNFYGGNTPRAPKLLVALGFEWLWRFIVEPRRAIGKMPNYIYFVFVVLRALLFRNLI